MRAQPPGRRSRTGASWEKEHGDRKQVGGRNESRMAASHTERNEVNKGHSEDSIVGETGEAACRQYAAWLSAGLSKWENYWQKRKRKLTQIPHY